MPVCSKLWLNSKFILNEIYVEEIPIISYDENFTILNPLPVMLQLVLLSRPKLQRAVGMPNKIEIMQVESYCHSPSFCWAELGNASEATTTTPPPHTNSKLLISQPFLNGLS